jgi:hypothetical protein
MASTDARIEEPEIERNSHGKIQAVRLVFGPHHFVEISLEAGRVHCAIGATHHGIRADAADVMGELERLINELKHAHPNNAF